MPTQNSTKQTTAATRGGQPQHEGAAPPFKLDRDFVKQYVQGSCHPPVARVLDWLRDDPSFRREFEVLLEEACSETIFRESVLASADPAVVARTLPPSRFFGLWSFDDVSIQSSHVEVIVDDVMRELAKELTIYLQIRDQDALPVEVLEQTRRGLRRVLMTSADALVRDWVGDDDVERHIEVLGRIARDLAADALQGICLTLGGCSAV